MPRLRDAASDVASQVTVQWRSVVLPTLVLWGLATVVSNTLLHPFDVGEYAQYAHAALRAPLLHRFPLEYPAPALVVFVLPLLLGFSYPWAFSLLVGVVLLALVLAFTRAGITGWDERAVGRLIIYLALGEIMVLSGRYDLFASAAALMALRAARRDHWAAAWTWSGVGFALKLFPAALWPVFLIAEWRRSGRFALRRLWWVAGSIAVIAGVPALFDHHAAVTALRYYLNRPTEDGGLAAGLSVVFDPGGTQWINSFHSVNVVSAITAPLAVAIEVGAVLECLWVWWCQARGKLSMTAASLATITFVMLGSKVLSVQYLMWLMPFWALYRLRVSWLLAAAANLAVFPYVVTATQFGYIPTRPFVISLTLAFLARDVLIAVGTAAWLRSELRASHPGTARWREHATQG